jgi:hypothetical protein
VAESIGLQTMRTDGGQGLAAVFEKIDCRHRDRD